MDRPRRRRARVDRARRETGIALLTLVVLIALGAALAIFAMANPQPLSLKREGITRDALAKAKDALIAYAATYGDSHPGQVPGYLPCPDQAGGNDEGVADAVLCGSKDVTIIGRLPWRTLGIEPLRDGSGECLWYAVSGTFKAIANPNARTDLMNWDTLGQIEVYASDGVSLLAGSQPENRAAAVIFAPGSALGQDRQDDNPGTPQIPVCSEDYTPARFLEAVGAINNAAGNGTAGAVSRFIAGGVSDGFNDRLLFITPSEIFRAVEKRADFAPKLAGLAQSAAQCLTQYVAANMNYAAGDHRLPWTAPVSLTAYTADGYFDDAANNLSGRYPFQLDTTKATPVPNGLASMVASSGCPFRTGGADEKWYENWKDHLFYAIGANFKPSASNPSPLTCGAGCLQVNGTPGQVAVVMFAGKRLTGQTRSSDATKGALDNYLEGRNLTTYPNAGGNSNYESGIATDTFNDILYCVALDGAGNPVSAPCS